MLLSTCLVKPDSRDALCIVGVLGYRYRSHEPVGLIHQCICRWRNLSHSFIRSDGSYMHEELQVG